MEGRRRGASCQAAAVILPALTWCLACGPTPPQYRRVQDCTPAAEELEATHPRATALAEQLEQAVRAGLPGALMAVASDDGTWFGAAGVPDLAEPGRPLSVCHLMPIKSVTKTFVSVRVLQLVEGGRLSLEAPLSALLPRSALMGLPGTTRITLRQLLNHTSGLRHYPEVLGFIAEFLDSPGRSHTVAEALDAVRGSDLYFPPGAGYHYSNTNTLLVQLILERVAGESLASQLETAVWDPAGLEHTHLHQGEPLSDHVPPGYMDIYGNGEAHEVATLDLVSAADGGMESTLLDLVRFSRALFHGTELLGPYTRALLEPTIAVDAHEWGYEAAGLGLHAWRTPLGRAVGHTGEDTGYKAYWYYFPDERLTWILLLNSNYGKFRDRAERLRADTLEILAAP